MNYQGGLSNKKRSEKKDIDNQNQLIIIRG